MVATRWEASGTGAPLTLSLLGRGGLPSGGIGAVALNVTVAEGGSPTVGGGYVTVYPCGTRPEASNLNFTAGQTIPNSVIAPVSAAGTCVSTCTARRTCSLTCRGTSRLVRFHVVGSGTGDGHPWWRQGGQCRGTGTPLTLSVFGRGGLPAAGIGAVALNVTVAEGVNPTLGGGYVTVYPCGTRPEASNLNFTPVRRSRTR